MIQGLEVTQHLLKLSSIPASERPEESKNEFLSLIPQAGMVMTDEQVIKGPDTHPYFILNYPEPDKPFQPVRLIDILDFTLENGLAWSSILRRNLRIGPSATVTFGLTNHLERSTSPKKRQTRPLLAKKKLVSM